jgi:hypothetical protein
MYCEEEGFDLLCRDNLFHLGSTHTIKQFANQTISPPSKRPWEERSKEGETSWLHNMFKM